MICKTCNIERDTIYFSKTKTNDKYYFNTKRCKVCKSKSGRINIKSLETRKLLDRINIPIIIKDYLNAIKRRNGLVTELDFFMIAHYYIIIYDYTETSYDTPEEEVKIMYNKLIANL